MKLQRWLAVTTTVFVYLLIVLGGWIRANNAGLSCPDWPTCYGHWVLTPAQFASLGDVGYTYYEMMLEWTHRFIAGVIVGPSILALLILAWRRKSEDPAGFRLAIAVVCVLLVQGTLGGVTVLDRNSPWSVALHLGTALVLLALMILTVQRLLDCRPVASGSGLRLLSLVTLLLAVGAMVTAAMTAKSGASLACYEWPSCDGSFFPALDDPLLRIHYIHRSLAALTGVGVLLLLVTAHVGGYGRIASRALLACVVVAVQVGLGAVVILLEVPRWSQSAHQATGVLLFVILSGLFWLIHRGAEKRKEDDAGLSGARSTI